MREGNKLFDNGKYKEAEDQYQKAVGINPGNYKSVFNLGDAFYKEGKNKEAAAKFEELTRTFSGNDKLQAGAYHNWGNALLKDKKYEEAISAYKKALSLNPKDEDTRYNLSYAQQMLKQQQKKENEEKKDKKEDKKENKNKDQKKDKKENKEKQEQKENENRVSKSSAQKMLKEVNNNERKVQNKLKKQKEPASSVKIEKDW